MAEVVSIHHPLHYYRWGQDCEGWNLVDSEALSVKQESMPANTCESRHYHERSQQFFYILNGTAEFDIDGAVYLLSEGQGIHVRAGVVHQIKNKGQDALSFLLCSQPSTVGDRINVTEHEKD